MTLIFGTDQVLIMHNKSIELEEVLKKIPSNKASGLDNIPGAFWKTGDYNEELLNFFNGVYNKQPIEK